MLVADCEPPPAALSTSTSSHGVSHGVSRHQEYYREVFVGAPPPQPLPQQQQLDLALEGRSILLQQRAPSHPSTPSQSAQNHHHHHHNHHLHLHQAVEAKTFNPLQLQLRIDLHGEQGVIARPCVPEPAHAAAPLSRRQRAQLRRRQEQQKPTEEVVYQRRTRARTPATCPRTPLAMSTMSMPAAGQKFAATDATANVFGSAEETSAAVKRLLAKTNTSVVEEHRVTGTSTKSDYLQDSFDFLHQRHMKNLSDVIALHQRQQHPAPSQEEQVRGLSQSQQLSQSLSQQLSQQRHKKQVHIHQSAFYDGQNGMELGDAQQTTFKSTKTINLSNNNSSNNSSCDLDDAKMLQQLQQQQQQQQQQRRCERENSTSSVQSQSSVSSARSNSFDNCNNNFCDSVMNTRSKVSSKTSSSTSSTTSSSTRVQQSFSTKKQVIKQSFSSSSQDFDDRIGIDVMLTPSPGTPGVPSSPGTPVGTIAVMQGVPDLAAAAAASSTKKVKQTTKVFSSSSVMSSNSDQPDQVECKQAVKTTKSKVVKKSVSDGKQVLTDVKKHSETAEEEAEGSPDAPVITFSHVSSEGSHQTFSDNIVHFDSSALSSPSRSRSPSPLLEMPAPYNDLSKEIKRPPMEKA